MKIALVQSEEEIKFIISKFNEKINFVPLNLESHTYLILKKINFINPKDYISPNFHEKAIVYVQEELEKLQDHKFYYQGIKNHFKGHVRFVLNYTVFLIEFLSSILNKIKVDEIIISGWDSVDIL